MIVQNKCPAGNASRSTPFRSRPPRLGMERLGDISPACATGDARVVIELRAMGKVVNLNKFRKSKARADALKRAETNRRLHGRTKAERARDEQRKRQLESKVDGARLDKESGDDSDSSA